MRDVNIITQETTALRPVKQLLHIDPFMTKNDLNFLQGNISSPLDLAVWRLKVSNPDCSGRCATETGFRQLLQLP